MPRLQNLVQDWIFIMFVIFSLDPLLFRIRIQANNWLYYSMVSSSAYERRLLKPTHLESDNNGRVGREEPLQTQNHLGRDFGEKFDKNSRRRFKSLLGSQGSLSGHRNSLQTSKFLEVVNRTKGSLLSDNRVESTSQTADQDCPDSFAGHLVDSQIEVCRRHPESLPFVTEGARMALTECQEQFRNERWNCSTALVTGSLSQYHVDKLLSPHSSTRKRIRRVGSVRNPSKAPLGKGLTIDQDLHLDLSNEAEMNIIDILGKTLEKGTKESAFIYATASAAVVYAITQSCSAGNLTDCSCVTPKQDQDGGQYLETEGSVTGKSEWKWGGCSDNVQYGIKFSRDFVDAPDREKLVTLLKYFGSALVEKNVTAIIPQILNARGSEEKDETRKSKALNPSQLFPILEEEQNLNGKRFYITVNESAPIFSYPYKRPNKQIVRHLVNIHNNQLGRKVVSDLIRKQCRCHGISGSCELKTCWLNMSPFSLIGSQIKSKYHESVRVAPKLVIKPKPELVGVDGSTINESEEDDSIDDDIENTILLQRKKPRKGSPTLKLGRNSRIKSQYMQPERTFIQRLDRMIHSGDMVHLDKSPNYCNPNPKSGIIGTRGRECRIDSIGPDSCDKLCCGRGYLRTTRSVTERCDCKFHWCCYVECSNCTKNEYSYNCK